MSDNLTACLNTNHLMTAFTWLIHGHTQYKGIKSNLPFVLSRLKVDQLYFTY